MTYQLANQFLQDNLTLLGKYSNLVLLLIATILLVGLCSRKSFQEWRRRKAKLMQIATKLPGPPALPLIGNALEFACKPEELLNRVVNICSRYESPFRFWLGPKLCIVLTEPQDIEVILGSSKASYKDSIYRLMEPIVGQGLVSSSGPKHRLHRKVIMPMLNSKVLDTYVEYFDSHSRYCADLLEKNVDAGAFNILPYMAQCTVDIIIDTIMGIPGTSQKEGYKLLVYWTEKYEMYELLHVRMLKVWLHPDWIFSLTNLGDQQKKAQSVIHGFTESVVIRKKKEHHALERGAVLAKRPRLMLLEQLIAHVENTNLMNDEQLRDEIYTIFTAAQDTTAVISSFTFLMLGMHPEIQDKVRQELTAVLGDSNVTTEHLPNLKYLELVIRETLRMFPIAPLMVRQLKGDVDLETCTLPEGCSVVMVPFVTQRNPKYWTDPQKFIPERFLPENSEKRHPYAYLPFSGGLRGCIGQKYAIMCLKTIIANVVRRYRLTASGSVEQLQLKADISTRLKGEYKVSISRI